MNLEQLIIFCTIALASWMLWQHLEISKAARLLASQHCAKQNLLLLDQSVILQQIKLVKSSSSLFNLERHYQFEFSTIGDARYQGRILFNGKKLKYVELDAFRF